MTKLNHLTLLSALACAVLVMAEDTRNLPLIACLSEADIAAQVHLKATYQGGTEAKIEEPSDELTGTCLLNGGFKQQVKFGELVVSAAKDTKAGFTLHTLAGEAGTEIMVQDCTISVLDWPKVKTFTFYGVNVTSVFPTMKDVSDGHPDREHDLFDFSCTSAFAPPPAVPPPAHEDLNMNDPVADDATMGPATAPTNYPAGPMTMPLGEATSAQNYEEPIVSGEIQDRERPIAPIAPEQPVAPTGQQSIAPNGGQAVPSAVEQPWSPAGGQPVESTSALPPVAPNGQQPVASTAAQNITPVAPGSQATGLAFSMAVTVPA